MHCISLPVNSGTSLNPTSLIKRPSTTDNRPQCNTPATTHSNCTTALQIHCSDASEVQGKEVPSYKRKTITIGISTQQQQQSIIACECEERGGIPYSQNCSPFSLSASSSVQCSGGYCTLASVHSIQFTPLALAAAANHN